jgi:CheY-like chemotaxis protein
MYDETTIEETGAHRNEPQGIMADGVAAALEKGRPRQVLVVEDESETASLIVKLLEKDFGVEAIVAENLSQAREKLLSSPFDLVTLDYMLPDGYGTELMQVLLKLADRPAVIVVTGHNDEKVAKSFLDLGVDGYIMKNQSLPGALTLASGRILGTSRQT